MDELPEVIQEVHRSLKPYVKQVQDVTQIRRVLALQLSTHLNPNGGFPQPWFLLESGCDVATISIRGIRRDYLQCVRNNIKAREEYRKVSRSHQQDAAVAPNEANEDSISSLQSFLDVVKYRRKHERLRILQDYVDLLAQKPAGAADHLDPQVVFKDVDSFPSVPQDVMVATVSRQDSQGKDLSELVDQLEKSVLRAKLLLKREQRLLARVSAEGQSRNTASSGPRNRLQALGTARNELINWIETELAKAGDSPPDAESGENRMSAEGEGKDHINSHLSSIRRQYAQYIKVRESLVNTASGDIDKPAPIMAEDEAVAPVLKERAEKTTTMSHVLYPYLEDLASISNQQKSIIQQKSHLTISLAKQLKETGQGLDRLADESHLLLAHPVGGSQTKGLQASPSFSVEISTSEKPDSSHRARAWVHAAEAASKALKEDVVDKLDEGGAAIADAREILLDLRSLLGEDINAETQSNHLSSDIWATLDGHLGVITRGGVDEV